jgi:hypothetical protein
MAERYLANGHILDNCPCDSCTELRDAAPPNAYEPHLRQLRAAAAPLSAFASNYREARLLDLAAEHARIADHIAAHPFPRLTAAESQEYAAPNAYEQSLKALRAKEHR